MLTSSAVAGIFAAWIQAICTTLLGLILLALAGAMHNLENWDTGLMGKSTWFYNM